jgi:2-polyprenyl-3-methyl-5-hydroxy-6-metoxy-1,4-benzoquinol methylase
MKEIQKAQTLKEDVSTLRPWIDRAKNPNPRPLDYWEYMFYLLGDVAGQDVLDLGCGGGWISGLLRGLLAFKGAHVWSFDASLEGCISTRKEAERSWIPMRFHSGDGCTFDQLPRLQLRCCGY